MLRFLNAPRPWLFAAFIGLSLQIACKDARECGGLALAPPLTYDESGDGLRHFADDADLYLGAAVACPTLGQERDYSRVFAEEFNYLTPENVLKWGHIHPTPQGWNVGDADALLFFARRHHMAVKGHALVWHESLPDYIHDDLPPADLQNLMVDHIQTLVGRYRGQIRAWDVVNEAIADDGSGFRSTLFYEKLGVDFIDLAFKTAHEADPEALLYYNDYGAEDGGVKSQDVYALVAGLVLRGVPIHGVGLQMHLNGAEMPSLQDIEGVLDQYGALGLRVSLSEMDVRIADLPGSQAEKWEAQAEIYGQITDLCRRHYACRELSFWGFTDKYSWIDEFWGKSDDPLPFDEAYAPKPAYYAIQDALK